MDAEMINTPQQPTAVVRETVRLEELPKFFSRAFHQASEAMKHQGITPAGPPFALYLEMPTDTVEVEAGFPVTRAPREEGAVQPGVLPGGQVAHTTHVGPYESLSETYDALMGWIAEHGHTPRQQMWEVYLTDPQAQPDPAQWRTEVYWPVD